MNMRIYIFAKTWKSVRKYEHICALNLQLFILIFRGNSISNTISMEREIVHLISEWDYDVISNGWTIMGTNPPTVPTNDRDTSLVPFCPKENRKSGLFSKHYKAKCRNRETQYLEGRGLSGEEGGHTMI